MEKYMQWAMSDHREAFHIGDVISVKWYALFIVTGMLLSLFIATKRVKRIKVTSDEMMVLFLIAIPMAIIFARIGSVFANYKDYIYDYSGNLLPAKEVFLSMIDITRGGLTILWGVPGGVLGGLIWAKVYKRSFKDFVKMADIVLPTALLAQAIGRWGNFMNQELFGLPVTNPNLQFLPYAVYITQNPAVPTGWYMATFFYEMVANILGFILLSIICKRIKMNGFGSLMYAGTYTLIRGILEFVRLENNSFDERFNIVQLICFLAAAASFGLVIFMAIRKRKQGIQIFFKNGVPDVIPAEPEDAGDTPPTPGEEAC